MSDDEIEQEREREIRDRLAKIERQIRNRLAVPKYQAGQAFGWGRRATDEAIKSGAMPLIDGPKPRVSTAWLRAKLGLTEGA
jgi:hypothetical protein